MTAGFLVVLLAVTLGAATAERNRDYWSEEALWRDTVEKQPDNPRARIAYGQTLLGQRRLARPRPSSRGGAAGSHRPDQGAGGWRVLAAQGRMDEAIPASFERAVSTSRGRDLQALLMLAAAQAEARRFREAAADAATSALQLAREQGERPSQTSWSVRTATYKAMADRGPTEICRVGCDALRREE